MDIKKKPNPRSAGRLDLADRQITVLKKKVLPYDPHLLKVDIQNPYTGGFAYEFENTPFEKHEVKDLQYMTMVSEGNRGIADARGDWQDEINSRSPSLQAARSTTATPNRGRESKVPLKKISIADYKNRKAGIKTTPQPGAVDGERPGHSRNTSAVSLTAPMSRVPSFEGSVEVKQNGASLVALATEKASTPGLQKSAPASSNTSNTKLKSTPTTNGHIGQPARSSLHSKDLNKDIVPKSAVPQPREQLKHALPPRPQSPPRKNADRRPPISDSRPIKRLLESADSPYEKRARIEHIRTPSGPQTNSQRKQEPASEKKHQSLPLKPLSQPSKATPSKTGDGKSTPISEKPLRMPPLLSPLPADLDNSPTSIPKVRVTAPTKQTPRSPTHDTIVVKTKSSAAISASASSKSSVSKDSHFVLPRLLSPDLPDIVEEELLRLQKKSIASQNTVEARHEKARQPNAPGVARKTTKTAKKTTVEASKSLAMSEKPSLVVKLKYKKQLAKRVHLMLKLGSKPSEEFLKLDKERLALLNPVDESEDDTPIAAIRKPAVAAPAPKKRPSEVIDTPRLESATKRVKVADSVEAAKSRPTSALSSQVKSPLATAPSSQNLLITPKKGDALKSVAMRKIDSSDGHARTPQNASTSTPVSAEKPRSNGEIRSSAESEAMRPNTAKFDAQALKLKRKMDDILQTKSQTRVELSEPQKIHGICVGLECLVMYMQSFAAKEKHQRSRNHVAWEGGISLWVYVDGLTRQFPILHALSSQIGAIFREELARAYIYMLTNNQTFEMKLLLSNETKRDLQWRQANRSRPALSSLDIKEVTGPWTSVEEITLYTITALEKYARKEKTGWRLSN